MILGKWICLEIISLFLLMNISVNLSRGDLMSDVPALNAISYDELYSATELATVFKKTVEARFTMHPNEQRLVLSSLKPGEMNAMMEKVQTVLAETMNYAFGGTPTEAFIRQNLELAEITAEVCLRTMKPELLASMLPQELRGAEGAALMNKAGAPHIAKLCIA